MSKILRREIIKTAGITLGASALGIRAFPNEKKSEAKDGAKLKVIVVGDAATICKELNCTPIDVYANYLDDMKGILDPLKIKKDSQ